MGVRIPQPHLNRKAMKWRYKGVNYKTVKVDWERASDFWHPKSWEDTLLVYQRDWDKVYRIDWDSLRYSGNQTSRLKAYIEDVYTGKGCYVDARKLDLVVRDDDQSPDHIEYMLQ